ncbi:hypothetical protein [Vibrio panuliri]|uniref:Uncharacterized protein n=1 Tax=Vibrio panuliri TaxID=1381081 RepID=A0ABX3FGH6_9VIBR|nr:hypothetical protein [Vibrio panuliri]KAB1458129.1 hypothetical protein F7O85_10495 [Vibrio panuliri]OLQ89488.1 hypothetical protein BIY20_01705 [Vibrio panuliri]
MNLHSCTIRLNDDSTLICKTVEQSLGVIEYHGQANITDICINATDGVGVNSYNLPFEESIESLMNL